MREVVANRQKRSIEGFPMEGLEYQVESVIQCPCLSHRQMLSTAGAESVPVCLLYLQQPGTQ